MVPSLLDSPLLVGAGQETYCRRKKAAPGGTMGLWYAWSLGPSPRGMARTEEVVEEAVEAGTTPA